MGAGFAAGIEYLERVIKATHIIMRGFSFGGGMMAEAILNHDFKKGLEEDIRYLFIADRSFSRLSTVAGALTCRLIPLLFKATGLELDGVAAAQKLSNLGIGQVIIQHTSEGGVGSDRVIPDNASLAFELHRDPTLNGIIYFESESIKHFGPLPVDIKQCLNRQITEFTKS